MMLPSKIKNQTFTSPKPGYYKASEVEDFKKKVYDAYSELLSSNAALKEKFSSLSALVAEYNEGKNSIATALIKSQSFADEIVSEAEKKSAELYETRKAEADFYYQTKIAEADQCKMRAETELERVMSQVNAQAEEYIARINEQAKAIIDEANNKASVIVSRAFADAQKARETCDVIVAEANEALPVIKGEVDSFKIQSKKLLEIISQAIDSISVPEFVDINFEESAPVEAVEEEADVEIEPFVYSDLTDNNEEEVASAMTFDDNYEPDVVEVFEDISSSDDSIISDEDTADNIDSADSSSANYIFSRFTRLQDMLSSDNDEESDGESDDNFDEE